MDLTLRQNSTILKGKANLEAAYGVVVQTRALVWPKLNASANYTHDEALERLNFPAIPGLPTSFRGINPGTDHWAGGVRVVQSIYEGGRMNSALRTAKLTRQQALAGFQTVIADTLLQVRTAYNDVLTARQEITVQEASLELLQKELEDTTRRFQAGTVPRFNVLRAEVAVANARPLLFRARNAYRIGKNRLANLLGYNLPANVWEDIPMVLTDKLEAPPFQIELPSAIAQALSKRSELTVLRKSEDLAREAVVNARAGYKPSLQVFGGYGAHNPNFVDDFFSDVSGWNAGVQMNWSLFDGNLTRGRVKEAVARQEFARLDVEDNTRRIELEVRTYYSQFVEAREVLESQKLVQQQADEALRLARSRAEAGTATQLDVLDAQTALTQARTTEVRALRDYALALARLERAIGLGIPEVVGNK